MTAATLKRVLQGKLTASVCDTFTCGLRPQLCNWFGKKRPSNLERKTVEHKAVSPPFPFDLLHSHFFFLQQGSLSTSVLVYCLTAVTSTQFCSRVQRTLFAHKTKEKKQPTFTASFSRCSPQRGRLILLTLEVLALGWEALFEMRVRTLSFLPWLGQTWESPGKNWRFTLEKEKKTNAVRHYKIIK